MNFCTAYTKMPDITCSATNISNSLAAIIEVPTLTQMLFHGDVDKLTKFEKEKNAGTLKLGKLWIGEQSAKGVRR